MFCTIKAISVLRRFSGSFLKGKQHQTVSRLAFTSTRSTERFETQQNVKSFDELPGPGTVQNLITFLRKGGIKNLYEIQFEKFQKYGPIFRESFFGEKIVHVSDAEAHELIARSEGTFPSRGFDSALDLLKDMPMYALLNNTDWEAWKGARSPIAPTFLRPMEIQKFAPGVNSIAKDAVKRLRRELTNGRISELKRELDGYATENILLLIFDERMGFFSTPQNPKILDFMQTAYDFNDAFLALVSTGWLWQYITTPAYRRFCRTKEQLFSLGTEFAEIREKKRKETNHTCLYDKITNKDGKVDIINGLAIALSQVGVETTSTALLWCLYHLSRNPEVQKEVYKEIVNAIGTSSDDKSTEIPQFHSHLPYVKACIKESLRLSQVVILHTRVIEKDTVLCGYRLPGNTLVSLWHSYLSQSAEHFVSPDDFKPERWHRGDQQEKINPFAYIPFGFGVRMCLGRRFAELELVLGLAHILQNFRLEYIEKNKMKGVFTNGGLFLPERELPIKFIERV